MSATLSSATGSRPSPTSTRWIGNAADGELLRRPELGRTEEDRRRSLAKALRSRAATVLTMAAAAWGWFYPQPHMAAIVTLAAIPLATVAPLLAGGGRYVIGDDPAQLRPPLVLPLFVPGWFLAGLVDFVVDWQPLLLWAGLGALALTALVMIGDPTLHRGWFVPLVMLPFLVPHTWVPLQMANSLSSAASPRGFASQCSTSTLTPVARAPRAIT